MSIEDNIVRKGRHDCKQSSLLSWTREELENHVLKLGAHNIQLQNLLSKAMQPSNKREKTDGTNRPFDFLKHPKRHILLQLSYIGWDRQGFAVQDHTPNTVEHSLFDALTLVKLIETRELSNYHRCGRTDKGVSAFRQTISITVRCRSNSGLGVINNGDIIETDPSNEDLSKEINYPHILNKVLPDDIRILGWAPVKEEFSARFNCVGRTYKYFFPKGLLNLEAMREASQQLIGTHDFRNLCKMDVGNGVINYIRRIDTVSITSIDDCKASIDECSMCVAEIKGQAFLWHQIRAIIAILFLVGQEKEDPSLIKNLLNTNVITRKPQYGLASEIPLILYNSSYDGINWQFNSETIADVYSHFINLWTQHSVKSTMLYNMLTDLPSYASSVNLRKAHETTLIAGPKSKIYKPLLERQTCASLEEKVTHFVKRKRLDPTLLKIVQEKSKEQ